MAYNYWYFLHVIASISSENKNGIFVSVHCNYLKHIDLNQINVKIFYRVSG